MTEDGGKHVSVKHICDAIGIGANTQQERLRNDASFSSRVTDISLPSSGGKQKTMMLPVDMLSGWLFMINPNKVKPSVKPALLKFRAEAFAVLDAWL